MSLRWRLTLLSTLILAILFALFSTAAYFIFQNTVYSQIDRNLEQQTEANLHYLSRIGVFTTGSGVQGEFGSVVFTYIFQSGEISGNTQVPITEYNVTRALRGQEVWGYSTFYGARARVFYAPFIKTDPATGQKSVPGVLMATTSLELPDNIMKILLPLLAVSSAVLLVIGAFGAYMLAGRPLSVVNRVATKARQIETSQDLSQRIPEPGTDDEIGNLVHTFNGMLERLDEVFRAQRRFVADSSHELRTPLTVIKGNLHLLKRATEPGERAELISITEGEISRLNRMVNDLLYMAQMQAGHDLKPVLRPVELDSLMLDIFALGRSMAALKEQKIVLTHEDIATTSGDRDQLQHLLLNLIDNAIKYTPQGGTITLGLWAHPDWARVEISDTGPGIDPSDLPLVFDRFFRAQDARSSEQDGAGLGLAIVRSIAEAHGGRVEVYSSPGQGTTFRVWLPSATHISQLEPGDADQSSETPPPLPVRKAAARDKAPKEGKWLST